MAGKERRAIKVRCYPTADQSALARRTFGCCRKVWNLLLADWMAEEKAGSRHRRRTPAAYKERFPYLKEVDALALCNVQLDFEKAVRDHFQNPGWFQMPRFKSRKRARASYTTNRVQGNIEAGPCWVKLPKLGRVRAKVHRRPKPGWRLKSATLSQDSAGRWFVSLLYEMRPLSTEPRAPREVVGLDWSSPDFYVDSQGERAGHPRPYRKLQGRIAREQRRLSRMQEGSSNWRRQKRKVARAQARAKAVRQDWLHKRSRAIAKRWDAVCVEGLDMHGMQQALKLGKSVNDGGWGAFREMLDYKAREEGARLVVAPSSFASTKTCSSCGHVQDMSLGERVYVCPECGLVIDRDHNAALNLKQWAARELEKSMKEPRDSRG